MFVGIFHPTGEFFNHGDFTIAGERLGTHGHWTVRVLQRATPTVTHTPFPERLALEMSLPVFTTLVCRGWDSNTQPSTCKSNVLSLCANTAVKYQCTCKIKNYEAVKIENLRTFPCRTFSVETHFVRDTNGSYYKLLIKVLHVASPMEGWVFEFPLRQLWKQRQLHFALIWFHKRFQNRFK